MLQEGIRCIDGAPRHLTTIDLLESSGANIKKLVLRVIREASRSKNKALREVLEILVTLLRLRQTTHHNASPEIVFTKACSLTRTRLTYLESQISNQTLSPFMKWRRKVITSLELAESMIGQMRSTYLNLRPAAAPMMDSEEEIDSPLPPVPRPRDQEVPEPEAPAPLPEEEKVSDKEETTRNSVYPEYQHEVIDESDPHEDIPDPEETYQPLTARSTTGIVSYREYRIALENEIARGQTPKEPEENTENSLAEAEEKREIPEGKKNNKI